jgi:hypothetical protein
MSKALATKNVAAVLLSVAMVLGVTFAFATPAKAVTIEELQAQIQLLLAQITALQGNSGQQAGGASCATTFTRNHSQGDSGGEVMAIQKFLNSIDGTQLASTGAGSPGNETSYFGAITKAAVIQFQNKYAADVLTPVGLSAGTGYWGPSSRAKANALCAGGGTTPPGTTPPPTTGGNLIIGAASQPANTLAPASASRVPFTVFTLTNTSGAAVTVAGINVQKTGLGDKAAFDGVVLVDSTGIQLGNSKTFNSNNQATLDAGMTIQPGQTVTLTVAGNMASDLSSYVGQVLSISVTGVNTGATVSGSLPITGASHTLNNSLSLGGLSMSVGSTDPDTTALNSSTAGKAIGTTGFTFAAVRVQNSGSAEDVWIKSIRWNQSGSASASDLANVVTVIDGTTYPTSISSDGKYYTVVFPGNGIEVQKGLQKDISVKADIIGGPARTIAFDIYKAADVYVVGETYGYGVIPTQSESAAVSNGSEFTSGTPFFSGTVVQVNAGTVSSVSRATEVPAQNIVILSPNQPLGGFAVDIKGEAITVASLTFGFDMSAGNAEDLDNVTLVNENGVVVAGPVDGVTGTGTDGKVTFTDTVEFPTGRHVYTLQGQLDSSVTNGVTIQATTTPNSTYWTSAKGTITGNSITISNSTVTGNTMTVRSGSVSLTISSTPAIRTIVAGVSQQTVGSILFDASASGEDVRFNSAKFLYNETTLGSGEDPQNCYAYNGTTRLNSTAVNPTTDAADENFIFDVPLVVAKGTNTTKVDIKCDIPSGSDGSFNWGLNGNGADTDASFTGTGVVSSQTITPTVPSTADTEGNEQTTTSSGALTAAEDSSSPSYSIAAGGTTGVTLGVIRLSGTNEDMRLDRIGLTLTGVAATSTPSDLAQVTIWDGSTQVGTAIFSGTSRYATTTITGNVVIPANSFKHLTLKGDLSDIGTGLPGDSGVFIQVDYDGESSVTAGGCSTRAYGVSSGQAICSTTATDTTFDGVRMFRSYPIVAQLAIPNTTLQTGNGVAITRFSVSASPNAGQADLGIGLKTITVNIATSTASAATGTTTVDNLDVYAFTDAGFSSPVSGFSGGLVSNGSAGAVAAGDNELELDSILQIPNGTTYYFEVRGDVVFTPGTSPSGHITTKLLGDTAFPVPTATLMLAQTTLDALTSYDSFVWSPNSTGISVVGTVDWTNGYGVPGLPASGLSGNTISK